MPAHRFLHGFKGCLAVTRLCRKAFQHLALVVDGAPQVVQLIKVPSPLAAGLHPVDAALMKPILDIAQRRGKRMYIMTARRAISGLVLKEGKGERFGMAKS